MTKEEFDMSKLFGKILILVALLIFVASCGVKGPPLPPEFVVPEKIKDLKVKMVEGGVILRWTIPDKNTDGTELTDLSGFKVFRKDVPDEEIDCPPCTQKFEEIFDFTLAVPGKAKVEKDRIYIEDLSLLPNISYTYVVVSYNTAGYHSSYSNTIDVYFRRAE